MKTRFQPSVSASTPAGRAWPLGVEWIESERAFNFALFSRHATGVTLLFYNEKQPARPLFEFRLRHPTHKTGSIWHCRIARRDLKGATLYAYRVEGPHNPDQGQRFSPEKVLLDPYAPSVFFPPDFSRDACAQPGSTEGKAPLGRLPLKKSIHPVAKAVGPRHTSHDSIIYELHVKGFTARTNSGVTASKRGTFAGLTEKIPYLKDLGVTIVELLPIQQFDPQEGNYWGYMTLHFFSPHQQYAQGEAFEEFRAMVKAFHEAGIEVWMDAVYNHTSEASATGPIYSFRGIDNDSYYLLHDNGRYVNDTGCGNTLRTGHPAGRALVLESLRFWARTMGVDGFRFDLASIFSRAADGTIGVQEAPLVAEIGLLARLYNIRVVAEAWDIASYQLGRGFPGVSWLQWNGKFRDDVRAFVRGEPAKVGALMQRLYGSDDLFPDSLQDTRRPQQSINFITAHDGFCLYDLLSYDRKHNEANGQNNADGCNDNLSWNCGWEGDAGAPEAVIGLRRQQAKNFAALLMLANGIPMIVAGDEFLNTQQGNNNPYNQDNEITWLDWARLEKNHEVFRFFKLMIAFRKAHPASGRATFWRENVSWYGTKGPVDFSPESRCLAYHLRGASENDDDLYVMINGHWEDHRFSIQAGVPSHWQLAIDTSRASPHDIFEPGTESKLQSEHYTVRSRSVVVLRREAASMKHQWR